MHESTAVVFTGQGESSEAKLSAVPQMTYCAQLSNITLETEISEDVMLGKEKAKELETDEYI